MASVARLRSQVELALAGRVPAPFRYRDADLVETVSAGIPEIDLLAGGLPRGSLTEVCGSACSGKTTLLLAALALRTAEEEACAVIDGSDAFDPYSAEAAGADLKRVLWVRCREINQALQATDLLIKGGGFGFIALDLSDISPAKVRHVPLNAWFRFRRAVENTPTILAVLAQESNAKTCASLVLEMRTESVSWRATLQAAEARISACPFARLLEGFVIRAEMLCSRIAFPLEIYLDRAVNRASASGRQIRMQGSAPGNTQHFQTRAMWGHRNSLPSKPNCK